nr:glutathione S-transferase [Spodoptera frugiperda]
MGMKVYKRDTSAPCRSVFMVLELLGIKDVEYIHMNLIQREHFSEEYLKMNPQHTIPTLKDGDFVIWDSHAIVTYLVNQYAKDDSLYPKDPKKRAIVDQRLHFDNGVLFAALKTTMVPILYNGETAFRQENLDKIKEGYEFMEKFFSGPWLAGESITLADICCVSNISSLNEILPINQTLYPKLSAWFEKCSKQDFYIKRNLPGVQELKELLKVKLVS